MPPTENDRCVLFACPWPVALRMWYASLAQRASKPGPLSSLGVVRGLTLTGEIS
jgi:hypothetical protein